MNVAPGLELEPKDYSIFLTEAASGGCTDRSTTVTDSGVPPRCT